MADEKVNRPANDAAAPEGPPPRLPLEGLSARDFERLCLLLVHREGYERAEHRGAADGDRARDLVAWRGDERWAFCCSRATDLDLPQAQVAIKKYLALPAKERPAGLVFLVTSDVSIGTRREIREHCAVAGLACHFWAGAEVEQRVKAHPDVADEFFAGQMLARDARLPTRADVAAYRAALARELGGISLGARASIEEVGALLPLYTLPYDADAPYRRENLMDLLRATPRLLVLGEPGSGQTVALQRLGWELATGSAGVVPILLPLHTCAGGPLLELVRAELQRVGPLRFDGVRAVEAFLGRQGVTCHFLVDGLDEVPPDHRDRVIEELFGLLRAYPRHAATVTGGIGDEPWRCLRAARLLAGPVVIQPLAMERVRAHLAARLGRERCATLLAQAGSYVRWLARYPLTLRFIEEAGAAGGTLPASRGELYGWVVARLLSPAGTPCPYQAWGNPLLRPLSELAFEMYRRQVRMIPRGEAERALKGGLLQDAVNRGLLAGDDPVRFAPHETMQDYFAALFLRRLAAAEAREGPLRRARRALWRLVGLGNDLRALARREGWAGAFVQLAGLAPIAGAGRLARTVARANPCLALWCLEEGLAVDDETRAWIGARALRAIRSWRVGGRLRAVRELARMKGARAMELLFRAAADRDAEVAWRAVRALAGRGRPAHELVQAALEGSDRRLWSAAVRCLVAMPPDEIWTAILPEDWEKVLGQPMVRVPPGPFLMGSNKSRDQQAGDEELPRHSVDLSGYWIGRFPVTVAGFRDFVKATGHKLAAAEALREPDDHPVTSIGWQDALSYCRWLAAQTGLPVALPSEAEWEKAARGTKGWIYPWGDEWDPARCNAGEGSRGGTSPVEAHSPAGDSPYGCASMAGNVWEWTRSIYRAYPYDPPDGRETVDGNGDRVLRGGGYYVGARLVRCAYRLRYNPGHSLKPVGFRVVLAPGAPRLKGGPRGPGDEK